MTGINRNLGQKVKTLLSFFPAVVIVGSRACGKTTLAKTICPHWRYYDLENSQDYDFISGDPEFFFAQYPKNVIIDEVQEFPELWETLCGVIDQQRALKGRFLLISSSHHSSMKSLAGRISIIELAPLKMNEFFQKPLSRFYSIFTSALNKKNIDVKWPLNSPEYVEQLWLKGGFPEPVLLDSFRDLSNLFPRLDKIKYRRFVNMLPSLSGMMINKCEVGRAIEANESTVRDYIEIAKTTFLWRVLPSFESVGLKSVIKMSKGYLRDTGLLHHAYNITRFDQLLSHQVVGRSFEAFVIEELIRGISATSATQVNAYSYHTRGGADIDLILEGSFGLLPIEIKQGITPKMKSLTSIRQFVTQFDLPFGLLINQSTEIKWICPEILQIPVLVL